MVVRGIAAFILRPADAQGRTKRIIFRTVLLISNIFLVSFTLQATPLRYIAIML